MQRRGFAMAAALALGLVGLGVWLRPAPELPLPATATSERNPSTFGPLASNRLPSSGATPAVSMAASAEWKADDLPATAARRLAEAGDKRAFYDRALRVGGGAYLLQAIEALQQCGIVSRYGMAGAEQAVVARQIGDSPQYAQRVAAFREHIKGCEGFETRKVHREEHAAIHKRLSEQTDLVARAYRLSPGALSTPEAQTGAQLVALKALDTGDAYLLTELAEYFAFRQTGLLGAPRIASSADPRIEAMQDERDAWTWAACDLGVDCGPTSASGRRMCFEMSKCAWKDIAEIASDIFAAPGKAPPRGRKDEIVAAVRAKDWSRLGF